jgi:serine/threonine protein phosphatase PrpC
VKIIPDNAQHIGARAEQQDAFGFSNEQQPPHLTEGILAVVADGMGGLAEGRAISQLACRVMIDTYATKRPAESIPDALSRAADAAQAAVLARARELRVDGNSGTTLAAAAIYDSGLHWISAGDTRVYLCRDGELTQLTVDHAYIRQLEQRVRVGELSEAEAEAHPERRALTSFLGVETLSEVDRSLKPFPLQAADRVLICTDGIHGTLSDSEIAGILGQHDTRAAQALVDAAIAKHSPKQDNATVALLDCSPPRTASRTAPGERRISPAGHPGAPGPRSRRLSLVAIALAVLCGLTAAGIVVVLNPNLAKPLTTRLVEQVRRFSQGVLAWLPGSPRIRPRGPAADSTRGTRASPPARTKATDSVRSPTDSSAKGQRDLAPTHLRDSAQKGQRDSTAPSAHDSAPDRQPPPTSVDTAGRPPGASPAAVSPPQ